MDAITRKPVTRIGEIGFLYHSCRCGGKMVPSKPFTWVFEHQG